MCKIMPLVFLTLFIMIGLTDRGFAQAYQGSSCSTYINPDLVQQIKIGRIPVLEINDRSHLSTYETWATSSLEPDTRKPVKNRDEEEYDFSERLDRWTCMYTPCSAIDTDTKTAWVDGQKDDGIGEILVLKIDAEHAAKIWSGIGTSSALFYANNRPQKVMVYVLAGTGEDAAPGCRYSLIKYHDIKVLAKHEIELKDINCYQPLPLPAHKITGNANATFVTIEILSVYKGLKYRDTGITELRNR
jgi:hypothetical protein